MIFDKIEIIYEKNCLPIKIKYSETRKPTFIEFLLLSIIINHPHKNKTIKDVLCYDFKILQTYLFEKALKDLISFKLLELNSNIGGWNTLDINIEIQKIKINNVVVEQFKQKKYIISQHDKNQEVKWFYDPLTNTYDLLKEETWHKKITGTKITHKLILKNIGSKYYEPDFINESVDNFIQNNRDLFGENINVTNIEIKKDVSITDKMWAQQLTMKVDCAEEVWIELNKTINYKIKSDNKQLENYLNSSKAISNQIVEDVLSKYTLNIKNIFQPKQVLENEIEYFNEPEIFSNINIKSNSDLLLVNGQDIFSVNNFLKNKHLIANVKYIIFYNSKTNNKTIETIDDKIIMYFETIDDDLLKNSSFIFLNSENKVYAYTMVDKLISPLDISIPLIYSLKTIPAVDLSEKFNINFTRLLKDFEEKLNKNQLSVSTIMFSAFKRIGLEKELQPVIMNYLWQDIKNGESYKNLSNFLEQSNNTEVSFYIEKCLKKLLLKWFDTLSSTQILEVLKIYNFKNSSILIELINKIPSINIKDETEFIFSINSLLETKGIDGWKQNIRNSLVILFEYANSNLKSELLDIKKYNSRVWEQHVIVINRIGNIVKELLLKNFLFVEKNYQEMLISIIDLIKTYSMIDGYDKYLWNIAECLLQFYSSYEQYKKIDVNEVSDDLLLHKSKTLANNFISNLESKLNLIIDKAAIILPIEIKLEWAKKVEKKLKEVETITKKDDRKLYTALNILYGEKESIDEEKFDKLNKLLEEK